MSWDIGCIIITPAKECIMKQYVRWIYDDRLVGLRLLVVKIHILGKHCSCYALRIILISCTNILAICTENCIDILHEDFGCLHWELYWYPARTLWLFALRIILLSCTNIVAVCTENVLLSCTNIVAVCTKNYTDILQEHCGCFNWEFYWYPARAFRLFGLRIVLIACTNIVAVCTKNNTDILHEHCGCLH